MSSGDKVLLACTVVSVGDANHVTVQPAGWPLDTIQVNPSHLIQKIKLVPVTTVNIQSGDIEIQFDAAVWGS